MMRKGNTPHITILGRILKSLPEMPASFDVGDSRSAICQLLLDEGYSEDEIRQVSVAVAEGLPVYDIDDPKNATDIRRMAEMIYPEDAVFQVAIIKPDGKSWSEPFVNAESEKLIDGHLVKGIAGMLAYVKRQVAAGNNVYITTNVFDKPYYWKDGKDGKPGRLTGFRLTENQSGSCTLILDLDVKEGAYQDIDEAERALTAFVVRYDLPEPTIRIRSGGGLHAWWCYDQEIGAEEWCSLAQRFMEMAKRFGLKFDSQCTVNPVGILRPPGTLNFKHSKRRPVTLDCIAEDFCSLDAIEKALNAAGITVAHSPVNPSTASPGVQPSTPFSPESLEALAQAEPSPFMRERMKNSSGNANIMAGIDDGPKIDLDAMAAECPMYRSALATGGNGIAEPVWQLQINGMVFTADPSGNAALISQGDSRFTPKGTAEKLDRATKAQAEKDLGYPSCAKFEERGAPECTDCPHRHEGKSPLNFALAAMWDKARAAAQQWRREAGIAEEATGAASDKAQTEGSTAQAGPGLLANASRDLISAGFYTVEILPHGISLLSRGAASGVSFRVRILGPRHQGAEVKFDMLLDDGGNNRMTNRVLGHVALLRTWRAAVNARDGTTAFAIIAELGEAGEDYDVTLEIGVNHYQGTIEYLCKGVTATRKT